MLKIGKVNVKNGKVEYFEANKNLKLPDGEHSVYVNQNTPDNSDYAKCTKEVLKYIRYSIDSQAGRDVRDIIKKHFA